MGVGSLNASRSGTWLRLINNKELYGQSLLPGARHLGGGYFGLMARTTFYELALE